MQYNTFSSAAGALALATCLGLSTSAWGQETTQETETPAETQAEETAPAAPGSDLSLGEDVIGETYTRAVNGDWQMQCLRTENPEQDPCQMYQLVEDDDGTPVAEFSLFRLPDGGQAKAGATIVVPLETQLTAQLTIQVDGNNAKRYPYTFCNQVGCYSRIGFTEEDLALFRRGNKAIMTIVPALSPDQKIQLDVSLTGFTKSYEETSVIQQQ